MASESMTREERDRLRRLLKHAQYGMDTLTLSYQDTGEKCYAGVLGCAVVMDGEDVAGDAEGVLDWDCDHNPPVLVDQQGRPVEPISGIYFHECQSGQAVGIALMEAFNNLARLLDALDAAEQHSSEECYQRFLGWRDVEAPCEKCGGSGSYVYSNTATWRGGIGNQMMTTDICDRCWGSGDEHRKWADLQTIEGRLKSLEAIEGRLKSLEAKLVPAAEIKEVRRKLAEAEEELRQIHGLADRMVGHDAQDFETAAAVAVQAIEDADMWRRMYRQAVESGRTHAEEREAWDRYVAAALTELSAVPSGAAEWADRMLDERRKRFGGGGKLTAWSEANEHTPLECGHCGTCWVVERVGDEIRGRCLMCEAGGERSAGLLPTEVDALAADLSDAARLVQRGREQERADIVAWLRRMGDEGHQGRPTCTGCPACHYGEDAAHIEDGEHLGGDDGEQECRRKRIASRLDESYRGAKGGDDA